MSSYDDMMKSPWKTASVLAPQPVRTQRSILPVAPVKVKRGTRVEIETRAVEQCRIVGFDCNFSNDRCIVEQARVNQRLMLPAQAHGLYTVDDFKKILPSIQVPTVQVFMDVFVTIRFDWHPRSWFGDEREFRCWWIVEVQG